MTLLALLLGWPGTARAAQAQAAAPAAQGQLEALQAEVRRLQAETERLRALIEGLTRTPAAESPPPWAAELARLQEELHRVEERLRQVADASEALAREVYRRLTLSVYGSLEVRRYSEDNGFLDGNLVELVLSGRPHQRLSVTAQIEFERAGGSGSERAGEIAVEQAWAGLALSSAVTFRAGIFLVPFGNVQVDHFPFKREVVTRPLINQVAAPGDWSDNGVGVTGRHVIGRGDWLLSYEAYLGAGLGGELSSTGLRQARQAYGIDNNRGLAFVGRAALGRQSRFELGLSAYSGRYDPAGRRGLHAWAGDLLVTLGPVRLNGEFDSFSADRRPEPDASYRGLYVRGVYVFGRRWLPRTPLGRDFEDPVLELLAQYDRVRNQGPFEGRLETNRERRLTLGLNYRPSSQWVLKATYERNDASNRPLARGDRDGFIGSINFVF